MGDYESAAVIENPVQLPPAVISPNKNSTRPPNIKERLNLHVKRRLQETTPDLPQQQDIQTSSTPINHSQNRPSPLNSTTTTGSHRRNIAAHHGRGGKRTKNKHNISNANVPLNSSVGDDECSRDGGNSSSCNDNHQHKEKDTGPDLLTMILNEKKLSLMRSPEIISFLESIVGTLRK